MRKQQNYYIRPGTSSSGSIEPSSKRATSFSQITNHLRTIHVRIPIIESIINYIIWPTSARPNYSQICNFNHVQLLLRWSFSLLWLISRWRARWRARLATAKSPTTGWLHERHMCKRGMWKTIQWPRRHHHSWTKVGNVQQVPWPKPGQNRTSRL